jgi:hypothetical protein
LQPFKIAHASGTTAVPQKFRTFLHEVAKIEILIFIVFLMLDQRAKMDFPSRQGISSESGSTIVDAAILNYSVFNRGRLRIAY